MYKYYTKAPVFICIIPAESVTSFRVSMLNSDRMEYENGEQKTHKNE